MDVEQARFLTASQAVPSGGAATTSFTTTNGTNDILQSQSLALPPPTPAETPDMSSSSPPSPPSDAIQPPDVPQNGIQTATTTTTTPNRRIPRWLMAVLAVAAVCLLVFLIYRLIFRSCPPATAPPPPSAQINVNPQIEIDIPPNCPLCDINNNNSPPIHQANKPNNPLGNNPFPQANPNNPLGNNPIPQAKPNPRDKNNPNQQPDPRKSQPKPTVDTIIDGVPITTDQPKRISQTDCAFPGGGVVSTPAPSLVMSDGISPRDEKNVAPHEVRSGPGISYTTNNPGGMHTNYAEGMVQPYAGPTVFSQFAAGAL